MPRRRTTSSSAPSIRSRPRVPSSSAERSGRAERRFWLLKTEPATFSFDDLWAAPGRATAWDGIRNYQARNFLRDDVRAGDGVLVYHSSATPSGIAGQAEVLAGGTPDRTQFDPRAPGFDPKATPAQPIWYSIEVRAVARAPRFLALEELRRLPGLAGMALLQRGQRLSVLPVSAAEWGILLAEAGLVDPKASRVAGASGRGPRTGRGS